MPDKKGPFDRESLHLVTDRQKDAVIVLMHDLIRRAEANEVTILAVTEHETLPGPKKHLEISYVNKGALKQ